VLCNEFNFVASHKAQILLHQISRERHFVQKKKKMWILLGFATTL